MVHSIAKARSSLGSNRIVFQVKHRSWTFSKDGGRTRHFSRRLETPGLRFLRVLNLSEAVDVRDPTCPLTEYLTRTTFIQWRSFFVVTFSEIVPDDYPAIADTSDSFLPTVFFPGQRPTSGLFLQNRSWRLTTNFRYLPSQDSLLSNNPLSW